MAVIYPTLVYKCPGKHKRPGGTFNFLPIANKPDLVAAVKEGWHITLEEAIESFDRPKKTRQKRDKDGMD